MADNKKKVIKHRKPLKIGSLLGTILLCAIAVVIYFYPLIWLMDSAFRPAIDIFRVPPIFLYHPFAGHTLSSMLKSIGIGTTQFGVTWNIGLAFVNSVLVTAACIVLVLIVCSWSAYAFSYMHFPGKNALFFLILATMMLPTVTMIVPMYKILRVAHLTDNLLGLIIPAGASATGVFLLRQYFIKIPLSYIEAARIDGANNFQIWWLVTIPLGRPALAAMAIYQFRATWNDFLMPLIILKTPTKFTMPIMLQFMDSVNMAKPYDVMIFTIFISALVPLIFFLIFQRQFIEGLSGGIRG